MVNQAKGLLGKHDGEFGHVKLDIGELSLNADLSRRDGVTRFGISSNNNPNNLKMSKDALREFQDGSTFSISPPRGYKQENVEKADLKAAFLAVTAKFGYSIAFDNRMTPLRKAIMGVTDHKGLIHYIDLNSDISGKILIDEIAGVVAMQLDDRSVVIPWPYRPLSNFKKRGDQLKLKGKAVSFPVGFEALCDFSNLKRDKVN